MMSTKLSFPLTEQWSYQFAENWLNAWNECDLESVLSHYADDVVLITPFINKILGHQKGFVLNKLDLAKYCTKLFNDFPNLKFKLIALAVGVECITMHLSNSEFDLFADVVNFDSDWKITESTAYY